MEFAQVAGHIVQRLNTFYGKAVDQLPYESKEGGYQGWHCDSYDLLQDEIGISLPRDADNRRLFQALVNAAGEDTWCEFDWLILEPDQSLQFSWQTFCDIVKYERRFFFQRRGIDEDRTSHPDSRSPVQLLEEMCKIAERHGLLREVPPGTSYYRARPRELGQGFLSAADLGPPPRDRALQSNRMNPPGIPMFYGANRPGLALAETRAEHASIGRFMTLRPIRLLDLAHMPGVPGFFSSAKRIDMMTLSFLHDFARVIVQPVDRTDRVNVEYIPTQVFTEFLRDHPFRSGSLDGLVYASATGRSGFNVVLFAAPEDVEGVTTSPEFRWSTSPWLRLDKVRQV